MPHDIRFGTWVTTANFCHNFIYEIKAFVLSLAVPKNTNRQPAFESEEEQLRDTNRIRKLQTMLQDVQVFEQIRRELEFVNKFYSEVPKLIAKLEDNKLTLLQANDLVDLVVVLFRLAVHECHTEEKGKAQKVLNKLESGISDNAEYTNLVKLCRQDPLTIYNFVSIHSMDCERLFAQFRIRFSAPHRHVHTSVKMITACYAAFRKPPTTKKVHIYIFNAFNFYIFCFIRRTNCLCLAKTIASPWPPSLLQ